MGLYAQHVFPRLCDWAMRNPRMADLRRQALSEVDGKILEIGFGTGLNLPHYPEHVRTITAVDPNAGMHRLARRRVRRSGIEVHHWVQGGERLPFGDHAFQCVVSTFTLCSIEGVTQALGEVYRVLRPGGRFLFLEHGLSPDPNVRKWQRRLNGLQRRLADGCRLDRDIRALVTAQPFSSVWVDEFYQEKVPRTHGYLYLGVAAR